MFTPIPEVVHSEYVESVRFVQIGEESSNDGTPQMTGMERFRNVWTRKLYDDTLSFARLVRSVSILFQER